VLYDGIKKVFRYMVCISLLKGLTTSADDKIPTKTDLEGFWDLVMLQV
jgi:hypothetical protein